MTMSTAVIIIIAARIEAKKTRKRRGEKETDKTQSLKHSSYREKEEKPRKNEKGN